MFNIHQWNHLTNKTSKIVRILFKINIAQVKVPKYTSHSVLIMSPIFPIRITVYSITLIRQRHRMLDNKFKFKIPGWQCFSNHRNHWKTTEIPPNSWYWQIAHTHCFVVPSAASQTCAPLDSAISNKVPTPSHGRFGPVRNESQS